VPADQRPVPRERGPVGAGTDEELVGHIRTIPAEGPFTGEGCREAWARLRHRGIRAASERVRRPMREHHPRARRRGGGPHGPKARDGTITTDEPGTMWGTGVATAVTAGRGTGHVFVAVDHCACGRVGLHAARGGDRFEAPGPLRQGAREHLGRFEAKAASGLTIRHGHGSNYLSDDFRRGLSFPGGWSARRASCASPRATAAPSGSSAR
jgi:hypothetical protein